MLQFIGCGSAFNTELGNNGAFIKDQGVLLLIDCGSSTFGRLKQSGMLEDVRNIEVLVTHTHPDHVGSLGDLIFYSYYTLGIKVKVYSSRFINLPILLGTMGVDYNKYTMTTLFEYNDYEAQDSRFDISFRIVEVNHVPDLLCYGYLIRHQGKTIYYSGDCYEIPEGILKMLDKGKIDYFYQDTCAAEYEGNVHMSLTDLSLAIPPQQRSKVWCMHLDEGLTEKAVTDLGFNIVKPII
ncbi:metal-dependent hydrolase [Bacillus phage Bobb]|uniref:Metal-dependent hydrolase n=1 Tax=Bacillus phage Bobb TaxID=1527469 RepID=A0A076G6T0_9CAUD|nr:metal-dependent hydrolase [Bacillus phage Bobb]AII27997.1 metal-dependent hydrolase [Bacillus phage Bobb]